MSEYATMPNQPPKRQGHQTQREWFVVLVLSILGAGVAAACTAETGRSSDDGDANASGGNGQTGGTAASGGSGGTGGTSASGGTSPTGGSGGSGTGGNPGSGGSGGGGGNPDPPDPSLGCGEPTSQTPDQWVQQPSLSIAETDRDWWIWLPENYDPERAYPLVVLLHGCGDENNNIPVESRTGEDAILVKGVAVDDCWDAGPSSPDLEFFEAMVAGTGDALCVDQGRVFVAGYSSGSWLANTLACYRGNDIRAVGSVAGGSWEKTGCEGQVARIFVHDDMDFENVIADHIVELERLIEVNHCDAETPLVPEDPEPCARYQGCDAGYPIVWCETSGAGHAPQGALASLAFWQFFSEF